MYATLESLKAYLRIDESDQTDDAELTAALQVATEEIDHLCGHDFPVLAQASDVSTRLYIPEYDYASGLWSVGIDAFTSPADLEMKVWSPTDLDWTVTYTWPETVFGFRPINATGDRVNRLVVPEGVDMPYRADRSGWVSSDDNADYVLIQGRFGYYPTVPEPVALACRIQAARLFARRDAKFGIVNSLDGSQMQRLRGAVDSDVAVMLRGYIRYWAAR